MMFLVDVSLLLRTLAKPVNIHHWEKGLNQAQSQTGLIVADVVRPPQTISFQFF